MLWLKALHVISVIAWLAGLLYLPRLLVYHAEATETLVRERLKVMERKLLVMAHLGATLTGLSGFATLLSVPGYLHSGWLHAKLVLVFALYAYHGHLSRLVREFAADRCVRSSRWLRWFNELPFLLLIGIVILVVVKPF
ncbi:MAG: CopD family protein [Tahibacter sp.]